MDTSGYGEEGFRIGPLLRVSEEAYAIPCSVAKGIVFSPFMIVFFYSLLLALPATRHRALLMLKENSHVELLTFAFLLLGGMRGLALAWETRNHGERTLVYGFYALFSLGLLFTAMEEVAWGQSFFRFETPSFLRGINAQGEMTIHNIRGLQGHSEFFRVAFGLGGLLGVRLYAHASFRKIGAPAMLWSWFLLIAVLAGLDLYNDYFSIQRHFDILIQKLSEVVEMMIGISGFLFIWLNARMLYAQWRETFRSPSGVQHEGGNDSGVPRREGLPAPERATRD